MVSSYVLIAVRMSSVCFAQDWPALLLLIALSRLEFLGVIDWLCLLTWSRIWCCQSYALQSLRNEDNLSDSTSLYLRPENAVFPDVVTELMTAGIQISSQQTNRTASLVTQGPIRVLSHLTRRWTSLLCLLSLLIKCLWELHRVLLFQFYLFIAFL